MNSKKTILWMAIALSGITAHCQVPRVNFSNTSTSKVTFASSGLPVASSNGIVVALYGAPDGVTNEELFVWATPTNAVFGPIAGRFSGGNPAPVPAFNCSDWGMFQYRAFEVAYGSNYEQALYAPPINGRLAYVGKSRIGRLQVTCSPTAPQSLSAIVGGFTVDLVTTVASITVADIVVAEVSAGPATATFTLQLIGLTNQQHSVDFNTANGTAVAGSDYIATNGTVNFAPGETAQTITIVLTPDSNPEDNEDFYLQLSNPVNCQLSRAQARCTITEPRVLGTRVDTLVTFNTVAGHHYIVEKTSDLVTWTNVVNAEDVLGTGSPATIPDLGSGCSPLMLYRIRLKE